MEQVSGLSFLLGADITDFKRKMNQAQAQFKNIEKDVSHIKGVLNGLGGMFGGALAVGTVADFGRSVFDSTRKMESFERVLKFTSGSAYESNRNLQFLKDICAELGLEFESTAQGFRSFAGAATQAGLSNEETRRIFLSVSQAVSAMGMSADDANGVFLALGQIVSKGKVQAEELRGQIGERLPGAFAIAARAMGLTTMELDKMMKEGKLLATDFLPKLATELEKTFKPAVADGVKTINAEANRLTNSLTALKQAIGDSDFFKEFLVGSRVIADLFTNHIVKGIGKAKEEIRDANMGKSLATAADDVKKQVDRMAKSYEDFGYKADEAFRLAYGQNKQRLQKEILDQISLISKLKDDLKTPLRTNKFGLPELVDMVEAEANIKVMENNLTVLRAQMDALSKISSIKGRNTAANKVEIVTIESLEKQINSLKETLKTIDVTKVTDIKRTYEQIASLEAQKKAIEDLGKAEESNERMTGLSKMLAMGPMPVLPTSLPGADALLAKVDEIIKKMDEAKQKAVQFAQGVNSAFQAAAGQIGIALGETIGEALAGFPEQKQAIEELNEKIREHQAILADTSSSQKQRQESIARIAQINAEIGEIKKGMSFGSVLSKSVMSILANLAVQVGKIAIAVGTSVIAIKTSLTTLQGVGAIAAGIALVALGTYARSRLSDSAGGGNVTEFANGGVVYGPTYGLMGEYAGASRNPEVIAPLDKLKNLVGGIGGDLRVSLEPVYIGGDKIYLTLKNYELSRGRFT